jgi:aspartate/methionine/tyrosine aminotransferase
MTGWRLGYLAGPRMIVQRIKAIHSHMVTGPSTFVQRAAALALHDPRTAESISKMVLEYSKRRELVDRELDRIDGFSCIKPQGTFYAFPNITQFGLGSETFSRDLLEKARVAVVPGKEFGPHGEGFIRLSFATSTAELTTAFERIRNAVVKLRSK